MKVSVITICDRVSRDGDPDEWGPEIEAVLRTGLPDLEIARRVVPEDPYAIRAALEESADSEYVLTAGGTGIGAREVAPEVTAAYCDRLLPGIAEAIRGASMHETPLAMLIRSTAGMKGTAIIVNLPGSVQGARLSTRLLLPIMPHTPAMIRGRPAG